MATPSMTNASFNIHAVILLNRYLIKKSFPLIIWFRVQNKAKYSYFTVLHNYSNFSLPAGLRLCLLHWKSVLHPYYISPAPQALPNSSFQARRGSAFAYYHMFKINTAYTTVHNSKPQMPNDFAAIMMVEEIAEWHTHLGCLSTWCG